MKVLFIQMQSSAGYKISIMSSFTHPRVVPHLREFLSSVHTEDDILKNAVAGPH